MFFTFAVLALAVLALWVGAPAEAGRPRRHYWAALLVVALGAGLLSGALEPVALVWAGLLAMAGFAFYRPEATRGQTVVAAVALVALATGLMTHALPGFHNPRVISAARFSPEAAPFTLYLNFDKTLIALCVLGWGHARLARAREWRAMLVAIAPWVAGLVAVLLALSLAAGFVRWAPKLPAEGPLWAVVNLLFVCTAEEALFRGFVQAQLARWWRDRRGGAWLALVVAAVLFGVAHAAGGPTYVALATVAGLGYGWIYRRTGRIEASILAHFTLNAAHFFLFTYPAVAR